MKSLVLFSLVICFAVFPLRAKPSFKGELVDLLKRIWGEMRYENCGCDKKSDEDNAYGEKYSVEIRDERSYDAAPQEAQMRMKRCQCDGQDHDNGSVEIVNQRFAIGDRVPAPDIGKNSGKRNRLQGGDGHQTNPQKATKNGGVGQGTKDPCQEISQLLPGAVPLDMLADGLQSVDENGNGVLDEAELTLFVELVELLRQCNN